VDNFVKKPVIGVPKSSIHAVCDKTLYF